MTDAPRSSITSGVAQKGSASDLWIRSGFDRATVGLAIVDADSRHVLANPAYIQQTGRAKSALLGSRLDDILTPESRRLLGVWAQARNQPTTIEVTIDRRGDGRYDATVFLTPLSLSPGDTSATRAHTLVQVVGLDSAPSSRDSSARLRAIVDHLTELVLMTRADGTLTYVSPSVERATASPLTELIGTAFLDLVHPDDHSVLDAATRTSRAATVEADLRLRTSGGWSRHHCRVSEVRDQLGHLLGLAYLARPLATIDEAPLPRGVPAAPLPPSNDELPDRPVDDSRGRVAARHRDERGEPSAIITDTTDLIWQFDHDGPVYANPAARVMMGIDVDAPVSSLGLGDIHPMWAVERIARHGVPQTLAGIVWEDDLAVLDSQGEEVPVSFVLAGHRDDSGAVTHWSSISRPRDRALRTDAQLRWAVTHDPLTALPGRVLLLDRMEVALARATRTGQRVGLLLLDLDFFETVNTSVGADIADRLLVAVAERLRNSIRPGDTIGRMGDDEFVVLCEHFDHLEDAERFAERLLHAVEDPIELDGADWFMSMSVGIAVARQGVTTADGLLRNANAAMYRAKELGRGRHVVFGNVLSTPELPFGDAIPGAGTVAAQRPDAER